MKVSRKNRTFFSIFRPYVFTRSCTLLYTNRMHYSTTTSEQNNYITPKQKIERLMPILLEFGCDLGDLYEVFEERNQLLAETKKLTLQVADTNRKLAEANDKNSEIVLLLAKDNRQLGENFLKLTEAFLKLWKIGLGKAYA
eukprot:TRINITY_DN9442_c0_g1_i1.p1 TRINITY_DN9442_c0_g1~~TRINITY_DN9442_c0_g1_i1.p1  ORF type:complete len:141 (+),score=11.37 TRINITY_DN9442_c0_g1_i1:209-631(+)